MRRGRGGVPFLPYEKGFGGEKNIQRSTRTLSGATQLHEVRFYVIVVAFMSPPLLVGDSTPFFSTNRLVRRLNPTSCGQFTVFFLH